MNNNKSIDKLFTKPLLSTRGGSFYNTFPYPTKISPETIAVYISCSTQPGDTILDAFSGSGSTGVAALLAENPTQNMIDVAKRIGVKPIWGKRDAVLYEIGTYASFATKTITNRLTAKEYRNVVDDFLKKAEKLINDLYEAKAPNGTIGTIRYAIWSEYLICPHCGEEMDYYSYGISRNPVAFHKKMKCPRCHQSSFLDDMSFATEEVYDSILKKRIIRKKRKIAWVYGSTKGLNWDRAATDKDNEKIRQIEENYSLSDEPKMIEWGDLYRAGYHFGITHLHHFYTPRNYWIMSELWKLTDLYEKRQSDALKLLLLSYNSSHCTIMTRVVAKQNSKDFVLTGAQSGVLYVSRLPVEKNILLGLKRKSKPFEDTYKLLQNCSGTISVRNLSSIKMIEPDNSIDFVFTDPPFGDYIPYAEVNQINELWLSKVTNRKEEVIISTSQNKDINQYSKMLSKVFSEIRRVTKTEGSIAVVFHTAKATVWKAFSDAIKTSGLEIFQSSFLDKKQASFKQVVSKTSVQGDPIFLLRKKTEKKGGTVTEEQILKRVISENAHDSEIERRHCYSMFIGICLENGIDIHWDAVEVYDYIKKYVER